MPNLTVNPNPTKLVRSGSIQVPLFDAPYFLPFPRNMMIQSLWPYYIGPTSNVSTLGGFRDLLLSPLSFASFQAFGSGGNISNIFQYAYFFGTTAIFMNYPNVSLTHPLVAGALSYPTYPTMNLPQGWITRNISLNATTITGGWFQNEIIIFNIQPYQQNNVWLSNLINLNGIIKASTPAINDSTGNVPGTFSLLKTRESNFTFMCYGYGRTPTMNIWPVVFDASGNITSYVITQITTDDPNLNAVFASGANNVAYSMTEYGVLVSWTAGNGPIYFPQQAWQAVLLAYEANADNPHGQWAPIQFLPQTANANQAVINNHGTSMKIDLNGIFYYDCYNYAGTPLPAGYTANSFGTNISIPGIPLRPQNNGIPLQAFCPCSPVAVGGSP